MKKKIIKERPSKYILKYGMQLKDVAAIFGVSLATIFNWLQDEGKRKWMEKKLQERGEKNSGIDENSK